MIAQSSVILIAEFLGKSAILIALGFGFVLVFRRLSPAAKHTLMVRVFAAGLVISLLWSMFPRWEVIPLFSADAESSVPEVSASRGAASLANEFQKPFIFHDGLPVTDVENSYQPGWPELIFALWALGLIVFLIRSLVAARFLRKIEKESSPVDKDISQRFAALRAGICPQSRAVILASPEVTSAFTWGIFRPRIVLPEKVSGWSAVDLEMILMHELEHVRRRDALAVFISRVFLALNWVNPLAWMAVRKTVQFREEACDARVLQSGYSGQNYAEMLFRQASEVTSPLWRTSATAVAENGTIEERIKMILNPKSEMKNGMNETSPVNKILPTALILIVFLVGMAGCAKGEKEISMDQEVTKRMEGLILPSVEFSETPLSDALKFLQQRSVELDPDKKGIVILDTRKRGKDFSDSQITLRLTNVPMAEAIRYSTALAQMQYSVKNGAVVVGPLAEGGKMGLELKGANESLASNERKMKETILPSIQFSDTPLKDALAFLQQRSVELDTVTKEPARKGVNVILDAEGGSPDVRITLKLSNVPLSEAFRYTASLAQAEFEVEAHAVRVFFSNGDRKVSEYSAEAQKEIEGVQKKLNEIIFPSVEFAETPLADALDFIQQRSLELDTSAEDLRMKGINVVLDNGNKTDDIRVTLRASNATLGSVLNYTATAAGGEIEVGPNAVVVRMPEE